MREVKFRGKRIYKGEWAYGFVIVDNKNTSRIMTSSIEYVYVDPETVGEYTGLKDKNGKEIYEGDIVQAVYEWETYDGDACFERSVIEKGEVYFSSGTWRVTTKINGLYSMDKKTLEVIGNKFQNPELLNP